MNHNNGIAMSQFTGDLKLGIQLTVDYFFVLDVGILPARKEIALTRHGQRRRVPVLSNSRGAPDEKSNAKGDKKRAGSFQGRYSSLGSLLNVNHSWNQGPNLETLAREVVPHKVCMHLPFGHLWGNFRLSK